MQKKEQLFFVKNICLLIHKFLDDYGQNQISQSLIYMDKLKLFIASSSPMTDNT